jgi:nucleotide-binding universal stress UspA family protein
MSNTNSLYPNIVSCVEHASPGSDRALAEARRIAADGASQLTLLHVLEPIRIYPTLPGTGVQTWLPDPGEFRSQAEVWLNSIAQDGETLTVIEGATAPTACDWARENGVDLLVAGSHRGLAERILLGSFAGYLARHAPCPVLLIRPEGD